LKGIGKLPKNEDDYHGDGRLAKVNIVYKRVSSLTSLRPVFIRGNQDLVEKTHGNA